MDEYRLTEGEQTGQGLIQAHRERADRLGIKYRLTEGEQTGQGLIQAHRERKDRLGMNTGLQRENRQVRG
jgi:RNase P/RNase MRP subunit POP5